MMKRLIKLLYYLDYNSLLTDSKFKELAFVVDSFFHVLVSLQTKNMRYKNKAKNLVGQPVYYSPKLKQ